MVKTENGKTNKKIGKIIIIVLIALILIAAAGIGVIYNLNKVSDTDREKALIDAGESYYEQHMSGVIGLDEASITLEMLKKAVINSNDKYDLTLLDKCKNDTKVVFTLKDGKIKSQKVTLKCK